MVVTVESVSIYVQIAFDAYVENVICDQLLGYFGTSGYNPHQYNKARISERERSNLTIKSLKALPTCIVFSALALESYTNLLGEVLLPSNTFIQTLDRLSTPNKLRALLGWSCKLELPPDREPMQSVVALFRERDRIVHHKPKQTSSSEEMWKALKQFKYRLTAYSSFNSLIKIQNYLHKHVNQRPPVELVNPIYMKFWLEWQSPERYVVSETLPLAGASFPSLLQYQLHIRRQLAVELDEVQTDYETKRIIHT
jgi:hypothetical protein